MKYADEGVYHFSVTVLEKRHCNFVVNYSVPTGSQLIFRIDLSHVAASPIYFSSNRCLKSPDISVAI